MKIKVEADWEVEDVVTGTAVVRVGDHHRFIIGHLQSELGTPNRYVLVDMVDGMVWGKLTKEAMASHLSDGYIPASIADHVLAPRP